MRAKLCEAIQRRPSISLFLPLRIDFVYMSVFMMRLNKIRRYCKRIMRTFLTRTNKDNLSLSRSLNAQSTIGETIYKCDLLIERPFRMPFDVNRM